jgi:hypothetical protein
VGLKLIFLTVVRAVSLPGLSRRQWWWKDAEILMLLLSGQGAPGSGMERFRVYGGVRDLLAGWACDGLLLLLDDMHSADPGTIELAEYLVRRAPAAPLLLVITQRGRQSQARLAGTLSRGVELATVVRMELGPLSLAESAELASRRAASVSRPALIGSGPVSRPPDPADSRPAVGPGPGGAGGAALRGKGVACHRVLREPGRARPAQRAHRCLGPAVGACEETDTVVNMHIGSSSTFSKTSDDAPPLVIIALTFEGARHTPWWTG